MQHDIPIEVFLDILSRLPAKNLLQLRSVCKSWRSTIDGPIFTKLHLDRQLIKTHDSSNGASHLMIILKGELHSGLYSLPLNSLIKDSDFLKPIRLVQIPLIIQTLSKFTLCSCNGVLLISRSRGNNFLWNPLTLDFHKLPLVNVTIKKSIGLYTLVTGLGFDYVGVDYKVVKVAQVFDPRDKNLKSETFCYSLTLGSWRRIGDFPFRISRLSDGVFVNGALHWVSSTMPLKSMDDLIVGLDLGTECYRVLSLPCGIGGVEKPSGMILGVLGGFLALSCYYQISCLDVWLMEEYGVGGSWVKLFSVAASDNVGAVETLRPVAYTRCENEVIMQHNMREFVKLNLETESWKKVRVRGQPTTFSSLFCVESLVRFKVSGGPGGDR